MGLRDELTADLAEAFDTDLADAVTAFTGARQGEGEYDPILGVVTPTTITYAGRGVFGSYEHDLVDGTNILATDVRLTVLQAELLIAEDGEPTAARAEPEVGDAIAGKVVISVRQDPAGATWRIQLRG